LKFVEVGVDDPLFFLKFFLCFSICISRICRLGFAC
jgi:hypothetical protein